MGIILSMPDADNGWVNEDLADAALSMPPEFSARLIGKVEKWAQSAYSPLLSKKLGSLMAHLARGGQVDEALGLARALLEVLPDARMESESEMEGIQPGPPAPTTRIETWDYEQILKNDFPDVVKAAGVGALALLCDLIQAAIQFSRRGGDDEVVDDYSYIWRRAIEDHAQNRLHTLKDVLVSGVRDAAELLAQTDAANLPELVRILDHNDRPWPVFRRIALHLLRRFPDAFPELVTAHLTDRKLFDNHRVTHEYALLLREYFGFLTHEQQQVVLGWIEEGPDIQKFEEAEQRLKGKQPPDDEISHYRIGLCT